MENLKIMDILKMDILSSRTQNLSLEARHTISLEVSKQRRLKVATSLFLPRSSHKQVTPIVKETDKDKEEMKEMGSHGFCALDKSSDNSPICSPSSTVPNTQSIGVITYCPEANVESPKQTNTVKPMEVKKNTPKKSRKASRKSKCIEHKQEKLKQIYPKPMQFNKCQVSKDSVIDLSSDEEEPKVFLAYEQLPPLWRIPQQTGSGNDYQSVPITQTVQMRGIPVSNNNNNNNNMYMGSYRPQYQQFSTAQPVYRRSEFVPGYYRAPASFPDFYTESYSNSFPKTAANNQINFQARSQPYSYPQRSANLYNPPPQQMPPQQFPAIPSTSAYTTNLAPMDLPLWLSSRYPYPVNQPLVNNVPANHHLVQQKSVLTLSSKNKWHAFYDPLQSFHRCCEITVPPSNEFCRPQGTATDYAISMMHEAGNTWNPTLPMVRRRMEINPVPVNHMMQQTSHPTQLPPTSFVYADSTTGGGTPSTTINMQDDMFLENIPASNMSSTYPTSSNVNFYNAEQKPLNSDFVSTNISPTIGRLTLSEDFPEGFYQNMMNLPEYDPRDHR